MLTGGRQTPGVDEQPLDKIKQRLLEVGALPFIVAIGDDHDFDTLTTAVEDPEDIFKIPSYEELLSEVQSTAAGVARRTSKHFVFTFPPKVNPRFLLSGFTRVVPLKGWSLRERGHVNLFCGTFTLGTNTGSLPIQKKVIQQYFLVVFLLSL